MTIQRFTSAIRSLSQRRFVRDTVVLQSGQFALIVIQALTNYLLIRILNKELGVYTLIVALAAIAGILDISGSGRVAITHFSRAIGANDAQEMRDVLAYFLRINLQYNVPLLIIFFFIAPPVAQLLYHNTEISQWARWLAFTELTDVPTQLVSIILQSQGNMRMLVTYETIKLSAVSIATVVALVAGWGVPGLVVTILLVNLSFALISVYLYGRIARADTRLSAWPDLLREIRSVKISQRFRLGLSIAISKNLDSLLDKVMMLFLGTLGLEFVGSYSVALKIVTLPQPLVSSIARNLDSYLPRRAGMREQGLQDAFIQTTLYTGAIWAVVTLGIAFAAPFMVYLLFPNFINALPLVYPLLFQSLAVGLGVSLGPVWRTIGRMDVPIMRQIVTLILILPVGLVFVRLFGNYGAVLFAGLLELVTAVTMIMVVRRVLHGRRQEEQRQAAKL